MAQRRAHLWISGYVQGVGYRHNARRQAAQLGLTGWVKNLPDGRVEVVAEGEEGSLQSFIAWCHRGPTYAEVQTVEVRWEPYQGNLGHFGIGW